MIDEEMKDETLLSTDKWILHWLSHLRLSRVHCTGLIIKRPLPECDLSQCMNSHQKYLTVQMAAFNESLRNSHWPDGSESSQ